MSDVRRTVAINHSISGRRAIAVLLIVSALAIAGCGTKQVTVTGANGQTTTETVKNIHFANTKFVLHMGLAFGAFHRYIYKPLRYGTATHRIAIPGQSRAGRGVHRARAANRPRGRALVQPVTPVAGQARQPGSQDPRPRCPACTAARSSAGTVGGASSAVDALGAQSSGRGAHITDIAHAL